MEKKNVCSRFSGFEDTNLKEVPIYENQGYIYLIQWEGFVKIGCTKNPFQRFNALKRYTKYGNTAIKELVLSPPVENHFFYENYLHNYFSEYRCQGTELFDIYFEDAVDYLEYALSLNLTEKIDSYNERKCKKEMHENERTRAWIRLPECALHDNDLSIYDAVILAYIVDQVGEEEKEISIAEISKATGACKSQVIKSIKNLIANKYITKTTGTNGNKSTYRQNNVLDPKTGTKKRAERDRKEMTKLIDGMLKKGAEEQRRQREKEKEWADNYDRRKEG